MRLSEDLGIPPPYPPQGPWPIKDRVGFAVVLQILRVSVEPGQYSNTSETFDTMQHLCSTYSNKHYGLAAAHVVGLHFEGERGKSYRVMDHPTHTPLGNEGFMIELNGLLQHIKDGKDEDKELRHVFIPLLGEFKGER
eukprot:11400316-Ditylum_brightwellii.AAC.1